MATTLNSSGVTFPDGTTQTSAGGAVNTTTVLAAIAGASAGAVGTYAFCGNTSATAKTIGATIAGSSLYYAGVTGQWYNNSNQAQSAASFFNGTASGTWRCMGYAPGADGTSSYIPKYPQTVWLRIS